MQTPEVSRLGELVLVWLLTRAGGQGARGAVARALHPFVTHRWSAGEWAHQLDQTLEVLQSRGLLEREARRGLGLTREGRARALRFLGVARLPRGLTWKTLRRTHLVAHALGVPASLRERLGPVDSLRAVLVQQQRGLGPVGERSLQAVRDELCWRQLGVTTDRPLTLRGLQSFLLGQLLGSTRERQPDLLLEQLAARHVGARRTDGESLRRAVLQSWLLPAPAPPSPSPAAEEEPKEESLSAFAARVVRTARTLTSGRVGHNRVFISHVWRALGAPLLDAPTFKQRLFSAHQRRLLTLGRADMAEWMEPRDVADSEVRYLGSTFHLLAL